MQSAQGILLGGSNEDMVVIAKFHSSERRSQKNGACGEGFGWHMRRSCEHKNLGDGAPDDDPHDAPRRTGATRAAGDSWTTVTALRLLAGAATAMSSASAVEGSGASCVGGVGGVAGDTSSAAGWLGAAAAGATASGVAAAALKNRTHLRMRHPCLRLPSPPKHFLSRQLEHLPQSGVLQPEHAPHLFLR